MEIVSLSSSECRICRGFVNRQRTWHYRPTRCPSLGCHHHQTQVLAFFDFALLHTFPYRVVIVHFHFVSRTVLFHERVD